MNTLHSLLVTFFLFLTATVFSQPVLETQEADNPSTLVEEMLLGSGVLVQNVTVGGSGNQIASFTNGDEEAGMPSGIVMGTALMFPWGPDYLEPVPMGDGVSGDDDLLDIANSVPPLIDQSFEVSNVNNIASLEFDFVPYGDSLSFEFVFASSEYITWVNSSFNDVFAFLVSGPGIEGPYNAPEGFPDGAVNIALVPDSDPGLPITVSSVNHILNTEYYVDNQEDNYFFGGKTTVLTANIADLSIGETYHIRLAIADGSDMAFPSMVFLAEGSFSSNVEVDPDNSLADVNGDGILNVEDLLIIIGQYGCEGPDCVGDFDNSGAVDVGDILFFLSFFE